MLIVGVLTSYSYLDRYCHILWSFLTIWIKIGCKKQKRGKQKCVYIYIYLIIRVNICQQNCFRVNISVNIHDFLKMRTICKHVVNFQMICCIKWWSVTKIISFLIQFDFCFLNALLISFSVQSTRGDMLSLPHSPRTILLKFAKMFNKTYTIESISLFFFFKLIYVLHTQKCMHFVYNMPIKFEITKCSILLS